MTRGSGLYDDESDDKGRGKSGTEGGAAESEKDPDQDTPDVDKGSGEPTA